MSGSLEQFLAPQPREGIGSATETFSPAKTAAALRRAKTAQTQIGRNIVTTSAAAAQTVSRLYRPRFLAHAGLLVVATGVVLSNSPARAHELSVRLATAQAGVGSALDETGQAAVAADIAATSHMFISGEAAKTASAKTDQVALPTTGEATLAKRQVVQTAGNATRDLTTYVVAAGDTLSGIAAKFNITSATLASANSIGDADALKPGQSLTILPVTGVLYTVQAGDTPESLASKFSANAAQITSYNNAEVKGLTPGTKIIIPDGVAPQAPAAVLASVPASSSKRVLGTSTSAPKLTAFYGAANGYAYGYCTWYVASRRSVPSNWGNANQWYYNAQASGFSVGSAPVPGAIAWTGAGYYGHVAYVESVSGGMVTVSEMNYNGGWNRRSSRTVPASTFRYIY